MEVTIFGKITLKGAKSKSPAASYINTVDRERSLRRIYNINNERLRLSDAHRIEYTVVLLTSPGIPASETS
jgi:2,3-dihydroxybenzoate decarboxylase